MSSYNLGTASGRIEIDGSAGAAGFKVVETAANTFFGVVRQKVDSIEQMGRRMQIAGASGVAGFGVAIKAASDFETQMSGVRAVTGGTEADFESLREKALQLGADTSYSASEAALAIEELAKAGIPVADILNGAAEGAVALAAAGGVGLAEAATIASNAMNQFGLDASEVTNVADILAGVANTSAADVSSLGQSLSQAGAVANLAGLSFKDTAIALGEMADAGINGSDAGTSLKTMLNNLIPTTDRQSSEFKRLGLLQYDLADANRALAKEGLAQQSSMEGVTKVLSKYMEELGKGTVGTMKNTAAIDDFLLKQGGLNNAFFDAQGNVKNLAGLQGTLGRSLEGMTKQQKLASLELLFGADAMRASAILSLAGAEGYRKFAEEVDKTSAADVAKVRLDNLSGSVEAFKGSMETAFITIGSVFLPAITKIVQGATWLVNAFNNLPGPVKTAIAIIVGVVSILLVLVGTILSSLTVIALFVAQWYALRVIGIATGFLKGFIAAQRAGLGIMAAWNAGLATSAARTSRLARITAFAGKTMLLFGRLARAAWLMALGPVGLIIAAVAAVIAIAVLLYKRWEPFRNLVDAIGAAIRDKFIAAFNALKPVIASVVDAFVRFGNFIKATILPVLQEIGAMLVGKLLSGWNQIKEALGGLLAPLQQLGSAFGSAGSAGGGLMGVLMGVAKAFFAVYTFGARLLLPIIMKIGQVFITYILPILLKVAGFLLGVVIDALVGAVKGAIQFVKGFIQLFTGLINFFTGLFTGNWSQMWEGIKQIFTGALNLIVGAFKVWLNVGLLKVAAIGLNLLKNLFRLGWTVIKNIFLAAGRAIMGVVRGAFRLVVAIIRTYINIWRTIISAVWNFIKGLFTRGGSAIVNSVQGAFRAVVNFVRGGMEAARNLISSVWETIKSLFVRAWERISSAVSDGISTMLGFIRDIPGKILDALGDFGSLLYNKGRELISGLISGITSKIGDIGGAMGGLADKVTGFLPGSPVKEGPLTSWNRGAAGKRLIDMLASGLEDTDPIKGAMRTVASYINGMQLALEPALVAAPTTAPIAARPTPTAPRPAGRNLRPAKRRGGEKKSRLVSGNLRIGPDGRAWIEGIAQDVYEENEEFKDNRDPRGGRRG